MANNYRVTWSVEIEGVDSIEEAANQALLIQKDTDPTQAPPVFTVQALPGGEEKTVDLSEEMG